MWYFRRTGAPKVDSVALVAESRRSLERANGDLKYQKDRHEEEQHRIVRRYERIIKENNLAELIRRAFAGEDQ